MTDDLRERVGRASHEAAKRALVEQGWVDHAHQQPTEHQRVAYTQKYREGQCGVCGRPFEKHHPDMADWDALPEERRAYFCAVGMAAYEFACTTAANALLDHETLGYEAGLREAQAEITRLRGELERLRRAARAYLTFTSHMVGPQYLADARKALDALTREE